MAQLETSVAELEAQCGSQQQEVATLTTYLNQKVSELVAVSGQWSLFAVSRSMLVQWRLNLN